MRAYNKIERSDFADINCHFWEGFTVKSHSHYDYYEINIFLTGEGETKVADQTFKFRRGDVIVMSPKVSHEITGENKHSHFNMAVRSEYFDTLLSAKQSVQEKIQNGFVFFTLSPTALAYITGKITAIDNDNFDSTTLTLCETVIHCLLAEIIQPCGKPSEEKNKPSYFVKDAVYKIDNGKYLDKSVSQIIDIYPISVPLFVSEFKKQTGNIPREYLLSKKLSKAKNLLLTTNHSVLDISLAIGFDSVSHFIKVFKEKYEMTPLALKKYAKTNGKIFFQNKTTNE